MRRDTSDGHETRGEAETTVSSPLMELCRLVVSGFSQQYKTCTTCRTLVELIELDWIVFVAVGSLSEFP
jgi:hypothetical protein